MSFGRKISGKTTSNPALTSPHFQEKEAAIGSNLLLRPLPWQQGKHVNFHELAKRGIERDIASY